MNKSEALQYDFDGGKYTVINNNGILTALRYGEPWRDLAGDKLVGAMLHEVDRLHALNTELLDALKEIADGATSQFEDAWCGAIAEAAIAKTEGGAT